MTGLNLETFLHLLRADLGAWATLGLIALVLALMTWTSWGARRALRKCLVLSIAAHLGLVLYGSTLPQELLSGRSKARKEEARDRIRQIKVAPLVENGPRSKGPGTPGRGGRRVDPWDEAHNLLALAESKVAAPRPELTASDAGQPPPPPIAPPESMTPEVAPPVSAEPESPPPLAESQPPPVPTAVPTDLTEFAPPVVARAAEVDEVPSPIERLPKRVRPERPRVASIDATTGQGRRPLPPLAIPGGFATVEAPDPRAMALAPLPTANRSGNEPGPALDVPEPGDAGVAGRVVKRAEAPPVEPIELRARDVRRLLRPSRPGTPIDPSRGQRRASDLSALALSRATPSGLPKLPEIQGAIGGRPLTDVPEVYRSRLDPNRSALAQRAGASQASEQAVERALDWLARHQDSDGRWDAGVARFADGTPVKGDDDFTVHCPPGEPCTGECIYWEADTALTGLALLAFLGSGYTQADGKYTETVSKGIDFLLLAQRPDGDLRGASKAVGMYCHAMATLALCEAYALTGDERLRDPVTRGVAFLIRSRARDGRSWRYAPRADRGDTSILGWVVMVLKSAKVIGIPIPATVQDGTLAWLRGVSSGADHGLASYQPGQPPTPTMTAEAWVCRQFLGVGGPGPASTEASEELLARGPARPGRDAYNLYYWYYGTLAMYQYGGSAWSRWNVEVRDQVVRRQRVDGHRAGSWDPDDSDYGAKGGRIYCTALATLTLEVYYRFLRLYDDPTAAPALATPPADRPGSPPRRNRS